MKSRMAIPPFPSQELAKLVLGYLAEEQLMTVYDEFLQASPYLDAFRNEYDRIFMKSLRNILAEYMAVKIYVESCKPFFLRKRLFQCSNLLEIVKVLVHNIDLNKIQDAEDERVRFDLQNPSSASKSSDCEVCNLTLSSCICKFKQKSSHENALSKGQTEAALNCSVETTSLEDLPGHNITVKKKHVKVLESISSCEQNNACNPPYVIEHDFSSNNSSPIKNPTNTSNLSTKTIEESSPKMKEFNVILNTVANNSTSSGSHIQSCSQNVGDKRISAAGTFQNIASDINNGGYNKIVNVPDSSTSENSNVQILVNKENSSIPSFSLNNFSNEQSVKATKKQLLRTITPTKTEVNSDKINMVAINNDSLPIRTCEPKSKVDDSKITILSDVRVENSFNNHEIINRGHIQMPPVLKNATSTPIMQMRTIFINGIPAYKSKGMETKYTKEEIMAMPTLILVPATAASQLPANVKTKPIIFQNKNPTTSKVSTAQSLKPLTIDISDSPDPKDDTNDNTTDISSFSMPKLLSEAKVAKPVEIKNASLPKDNTITSLTKTSTPQVVPPLRKSSSTPRRTSHVRVLDFTTPRRILHETINEQNENVMSPQHKSVNPPLLLTDSSKTETVSKEINVTSNTSEISYSVADNKNPTQESKTKSKCNWDADLRALVGVNESDSTVSSSKRKSKTKSKKKKKEVDTEDKKSDTTISDTATPKTNGVKQRRRKTIDVDEESEKVVEKPVDIPIKPTINIISGIDKNPCSVQESEKNQNKNNSDDLVNTPENERLSLQNAIGAKLNISDLLETPYKQALYDIQMETPRFLGPDLPDEPFSNIKIMNIPTPKFLASPNSAVTPKPLQSTPSSYCSRPTDYSSGGSYYKPDEHDNIPILEDLRCSITSLKTQERETNEPYSEETSIKKTNASKENENKDGIKSRPVRQCTKNVSYSYNSPLNFRTKKDDSIDAVSSCSETISITSSCENKLEKISTQKVAKEGHSNCSKSQKVKPDKKKRVSLRSSLKTKSPFKKDTSKSFMKIKPIRTTPKKNVSIGRGRKKFEPSQMSLVNQIRKRTTSKEKSTTTETVVTPAPTKSRRKSSTPRKLDCSKTSVSSAYNPSECLSKAKKNVTQSSNTPCTVDSDSEQLHLHWSDDGSQEAKHKETQASSTVNEGDDIKKIQEYIETTTQSLCVNDAEGSLHIDLIKRGFDVETAKIIERDLLDTPPHPGINKTLCDELTKAKEFMPSVEKSVESDITPVNLDEDDELTDDIELSVHECNEDINNFITCHHDDTKDTLHKEPVKLKDKFSMEICIEEGVAIRLRATPFTLILDQKPQDVVETEQAVNSISNFDNLYTPMKESVRAQYYDIFDSTLTSLDTPLKVSSPRRRVQDAAITEVVLEVEKIEERLEIKEKAESKKRKRVQSGSTSDESLSDNKRTRTEAQYLLNSANIQNIDIESVLSKLHGP